MTLKAVRDANAEKARRNFFGFPVSPGAVRSLKFLNDGIKVQDSSERIKSPRVRKKTVDRVGGTRAPRVQHRSDQARDAIVGGSRKRFLPSPNMFVDYSPLTPSSERMMTVGDIPTSRGDKAPDRAVPAMLPVHSRSVETQNAMGEAPAFKGVPRHSTIAPGHFLRAMFL